MYVLNLAQYVGKGRQQAARIIELSDHRYALISMLQRAGYVLYRALGGDAMDLELRRV